MNTPKEKLRIDKYLWAIRLFKTRTQASDACDSGKVKYQGNSVKASKAVNIGEEYEAKTEAKKWVVKVTGLLDHRVQYSEAVNFYMDLTPAEDVQRLAFDNESFHTGKRLSKIGRPSKKQRRSLEDHFGPLTGIIQKGLKWLHALQNNKPVIYRQKQSITFMVSKG